jgi:GH15 family glucan-1,4-alpha-glucosidase
MDKCALGYARLLFAAADGFRRFIQRSSAVHGDEIQLMYGLGGEQPLTEINLEYLEAARGARPVRIGNAASRQLQLDMYGELLELTWQWAQRGHTPDNDYWAFLIEVVDRAAEKWTSPDHGIWEIRGRPQHFVFSTIICWVAASC